MELVVNSALARNLWIYRPLPIAVTIDLASLIPPSAGAQTYVVSPTWTKSARTIL
jgi:hypothetical protein